LSRAGPHPDHPSSPTRRSADLQTATDTFSYTVDDGHGGSDTATVTVTITGENDAPDAHNVSASANEDTGNPITVTADYTDVDTSDRHTTPLNTTHSAASYVRHH